MLLKEGVGALPWLTPHRRDTAVHIHVNLRRLKKAEEEERGRCLVDGSRRQVEGVEGVGAPPLLAPRLRDTAVHMNAEPRRKRQRKEKGSKGQGFQ